MERRLLTALLGVAALAFCLSVRGATVVPNEIQQPGTQPGQVSNLETPDKCDNCHGGYNSAVEPAFNWRGSMMANAGRDPIFWATLAIAEQDFDGAG
ncbi:MAG: Fibronectin type domain protein, partial [Burkholderiaceae bacterium]|nr:Fibronectin type domain protein [Burkholderiaceae bacterium]